MAVFRPDAQAPEWQIKGTVAFLKAVSRKIQQDFDAACEEYGRDKIAALEKIGLMWRPYHDDPAEDVQSWMLTQYGIEALHYYMFSLQLQEHLDRYFRKRAKSHSQTYKDGYNIR